MLDGSSKVQVPPPFLPSFPCPCACTSFDVVLQRVEVGFDYVVAAELAPEPEERSSVSAEEKGRKDPIDAPEDSKEEAVAAVGVGGEGKAGEPEGRAAAEATVAR